MTSRNDRLARHTNAVNLARRYSVQNENDLLQESYYEEEEPPMAVKVFDHAYCQELSHHLLHPKALPEECKKFTDVVNYLKRHDTACTQQKVITAPNSVWIENTSVQFDHDNKRI